METAGFSSAEAVLDAYFLEVRAKLIEIAATLDRMDRAAAGAQGHEQDTRMAFVQNALAILAGDKTNKAEQILCLYSC